ncbi:MAG: hypothetical protein Q8O35_08800, partial [Humidesulfovibrio sp.]|nr:hypothetical protein [Humidesulfovibrio sp.]
VPSRRSEPALSLAEVSEWGPFPSIGPARLCGAQRREAAPEIDGKSARPATPALSAPMGSALDGRPARRACGVQRAHALWRG